MPHCSAACSRNLCCSGCSVSPFAMPSIVSIRRPPTSQPSTRHEQTSRPSSVTLQAPQSPEPQPSLLPVSCSVSRSTSSSVSSVSQRNSTASPFTVASTWCLAISVPSLGRARSTPRGAPARPRRRRGIRSCLVCRRSAGTRPSPPPRAAPARPASRRLPTIACAASATSSTRAATAPSDTRAAVIVPAASTVRLTPAPTTAMSISVRGMKRR